MNNQRFKRGEDASNANMGRRYNNRNKFNNFKVRTKFDTGVQYSRQIRFNTSNRDNYSRDNNYEQHDRRDNDEQQDANYDNRSKWSNSKYPSNRQFNSQSSRRSRRNQRQSHTKDNRDDADSQWFKITIPHGNKCDKQFILRSIQSEVQLTFTPYNYHTENGSIVFFVLGTETADTLKSITRRIATPLGFKLLILVNRSAIPPTPINEELTETVKTVMSSRYNADLKIMDLSKFREDTNLQQLGLYVPLSRPNMLTMVVKIIIDNTPDFVGLNLRDNKLTSLEPLLSLVNTCKYLQAVDLSINQIRYSNELDNIKSLELIELALDGNPICESFGDQATYISYIRSKFPKLQKLDGEELPAAIGFDVQEVSNLPATQPSYLQEDYKQFIHGFFEAFYNIYDSDDRQGLIQAYHDQALFSLSISRPDNNSYKFPEELIRESRNLLRVKDFNQRNKLLKVGKVNIVSALCEMPKTKHDPQSFVVDVPICTNLFISVVVNGVFRELLKKNQPLRAFCRTFFIVPQGQGFVIVNDMLLLTNATVQQIQNYGQTSKPAIDRAMNDVYSQPSSSSSSSSKPLVRTANATDNKYESVIQRFMSATKMNKPFALKCLEENHYSLEAAYQVFQELSLQNAIPSEAFEEY